MSFWSALTDRVDARYVYLAGSLLAAAASAGFGLSASGFFTAVLFQVILGVGVAATYMPGLRMLSDRISGPFQSRYIAFYTSFFGIGIALSLAGFIAPRQGWAAAFLWSALGPLAAGLAVYFMIDAFRPAEGKAFRSKPCFRWRSGAACSPSARAPAICSATPRIA